MMKQCCKSQQELTDGPDTNFLSREEFYTDALRRAVHQDKLIADWKITDQQEKQWLSNIAFPFEARPDTVHGG